MAFLDPSPSSPIPNPDEIATVVVDGQQLEFWESVFVQSKMNEAYPTFKFRVIERDPIPGLISRLQFGPGDIADVYLAGILAVHGVITTRQVAYAAEEHGVELEGKGVQWLMVRASIPPDKNTNFDNKNFQQIATEISALFGLPPPVVQTAIDMTPYKTARFEPGERVWNFLEKHARVRGIRIEADTKTGALLLRSVTDSGAINPLKEGARSLIGLQEGVNILRMQCMFSWEEVYSAYWAIAQGTGSDGHNMTASSEMKANVESEVMRRFYSPNVTPQEIPVWNQAEVQMRAKYEQAWGDNSLVEAHITVQGWKRPGVNDIWRAGDSVLVISPMCPLNMVMVIHGVTYLQDSNSGSTSILQCVDPKHAGVHDEYNASAKAQPPATTPAAPVPPGTPIAPIPPIELFPPFGGT